MNYTPIVLGVTAVGLLAWAFKDDIKKLFAPKDTTTDDTEQSETPVIETIVTNSGVGVSPAGITQGLSGMGTPKDRLNLNQSLKNGDRGQEVAKLQQILNRIAKIYGTQTIAEDGNFGPGTQSKLTKIYGAGSINLFKAYAMLFAIWNANNNKDLKNWNKKYFNPYLTDQTRYANARQFYFANNEMI